jgi:hypothetical protein
MEGLRANRQKVDAPLRESADDGVGDGERARQVDLNSVASTAGALDNQAAQIDVVALTGIDRDAVGAGGNEDAGGADAVVDDADRLVIDTVPKSPTSTVLISPPATVVLCALWNVRQGAVRVQELVSRPLTDTNERLFCADADVVMRPSASRVAAKSDNVTFDM